MIKHNAIPLRTAGALSTSILSSRESTFGLSHHHATAKASSASTWHECVSKTAHTAHPVTQGPLPHSSHTLSGLRQSMASKSMSESSSLCSSSIGGSGALSTSLPSSKRGCTSGNLQQASLCQVYSTLNFKMFLAGSLPVVSQSFMPSSCSASLRLTQEMCPCNTYSPELVHLYRTDEVLHC